MTTCSREGSKYILEDMVGKGSTLKFRLQVGDGRYAHSPPLSPNQKLNSVCRSSIPILTANCPRTMTGTPSMMKAPPHLSSPDMSVRFHPRNSCTATANSLPAHFSDGSSGVSKKQRASVHRCRMMGLSRRKRGTGHWAYRLYVSDS